MDTYTAVDRNTTIGSSNQQHAPYPSVVDRKYNNTTTTNIDVTSIIMSPQQQQQQQHDRLSSTLLSCTSQNNCNNSNNNNNNSISSSCSAILLKQSTQCIDTIGFQKISSPRRIRRSTSTTSSSNNKDSPRRRPPVSNNKKFRDDSVLHMFHHHQKEEQWNSSSKQLTFDVDTYQNHHTKTNKQYKYDMNDCIATKEDKCETNSDIILKPMDVNNNDKSLISELLKQGQQNNEILHFIFGNDGIDSYPTDNNKNPIQKSLDEPNQQQQQHNIQKKESLLPSTIDATDATPCSSDGTTTTTTTITTIPMLLLSPQKLSCKERFQHIKEKKMTKILLPSIDNIIISNNNNNNNNINNSGYNHNSSCTSTTLLVFTPKTIPKVQSPHKSSITTTTTSRLLVSFHQSLPLVPLEQRLCHYNHYNQHHNGSTNKSTFHLDDTTTIVKKRVRFIIPNYTIFHTSSSSSYNHRIIKTTTPTTTGSTCTYMDSTTRDACFYSKKERKAIRANASIIVDNFLLDYPDTIQVLQQFYNSCKQSRLCEEQTIDDISASVAAEANNNSSNSTNTMFLQQSVTSLINDTIDSTSSTMSLSSIPLKRKEYNFVKKWCKSDIRGLEDIIKISTTTNMLDHDNSIVTKCVLKYQETYKKHQQQQVYKNTCSTNSKVVIQSSLLLSPQRLLRANVNKHNNTKQKGINNNNNDKYTCSKYDDHYYETLRNKCRKASHSSREFARKIAIGDMYEAYQYYLL